MNIERGLLSALILIVTSSMSLLSPQSIYRFLPLIFGIIASTGYILKRLFIFDTGIFVSILTYLFAVSDLPFDIYNLFGVMGFFFLLIGIWFYTRNILLISGIEEVAGPRARLSMYKRSSLGEILNTLLSAAFLSIIASFIVLYSSLGIDMGSLIDLLIVVILSAAVFFITFLIIKLLSSQEIRTENDS